MGLIVDMVPNHMGIMGADNSWWLDVLENGPASRFAGYFDIDWYPIAEDLPGRVLLPVLGDHYGVELAGGKLQLGFDAATGSFARSRRRCAGKSPSRSWWPRCPAPPTTHSPSSTGSSP